MSDFILGIKEDTAHPLGFSNCGLLVFSENHCELYNPLIIMSGI